MEGDNKLIHHLNHKIPKKKIAAIVLTVAFVLSFAGFLAISIIHFRGKRN
jgi:hypothetical protein